MGSKGWQTRIGAAWQALSCSDKRDEPPPGDTPNPDSSPSKFPAWNPSEIQHLVDQEKDSRRFLQQIARHEPLPNILKHLVDTIEHQNPQLRGCFTLMRDDRVCYAVAPTLGGSFAAAVEQVATVSAEFSAAGKDDAQAPAVFDLLTHPHWQARRELLDRESLRTCWVMPIVSEGETLGALQIFTSLSTGPTEADARVMRMIADQAAIAIEHQDLLERLQFQSMHDPLTGLPNRLLLDDRLQNAVYRAHRASVRVGLFLINIDRFKVINDTLGHGCGDELLRQLSQRLAQSFRGSDTVARIGADEFAILTPDIRTRESAMIVSDKLLSVISEPITIAGREIAATASIGAAVYPDDAADQSALRRSADRALARAKASGRNRVVFFEKGAAQDSSEEIELDLQSQLRRAVENHELKLAYQPQVDSMGNLIGVEALLRWENPKLGRVSPAQFIPVAEQTGLIIPIGEWVLREACRQARLWNDRPESPQLRIAVNVSALQFAQPGFVRIVEEVLSQTGIDPRFVELELTESLLMQNTQDAAAKLSSLRAMGVAAAIDDFGTGYSSLAYLRRLPIDTLKIDRSFVNDIAPDNGDDSGTAVIRAIVSMARSLNLQVVAEGVETEQQRDFLIRLGCQLMQGYLLGRPQASTDIDRLLDARLANVPQPLSA